MAKKSSTFEKAAGFLVAFLAIGFFATALDRFMGWNAESSGWKAGAVTLGATLLAFVGLKTFKKSGWARTTLIAGLAATGVQVLVRPVNDAGRKLADWMRSGMKLAPLPAMQPGTGSYSPPQVDTFSATPPGALQPFAGSPSGFAAPAAPAPAAPAPAPQQQPQTIIYQAPKIKSSDYLLGKGIDALATVGGAVAGSLLKGSASDNRAMRFGMAS